MTYDKRQTTYDTANIPAKAGIFQN